ncbi:hypothetical protein [Streptomyces sp. NPDC097619]|uniref:hypothetical protein n=1 Tax=Streptomyces sp. NPDC097619 TaxID=3157228 RepID=UPI00331A9E8D
MGERSGRGRAGRVRAAAGVAVVACAVAGLAPGAAVAGPAGGSGARSGALTTGVERLSLAADGTQGNGPSGAASIAADGLRVVFASSAGNLTSDPAAGGEAVFVRDVPTGLNRRMGSLGPVGPPAISGNGQYVAYAHPWVNNTRVRMYRVSSGATISADCSAFSCNQPSMSTDGRYTALAVLKYGASSQVIEVQDGQTGARTAVATLPHTQASRPSLSGDGRYTAYQNAQSQDVFVWDRTTGVTTGPLEGAGTAASLVQIGDDGTKVVYLVGSDTRVHDLATGTAQTVPGVRGLAIDPTGRHLLYAPVGGTGPALVLRDLLTGTERTVSDGPATAGTDSVGTDGREVVFQSAAADLVPDDTNGVADVFLRRFS